MDDLQDAFVCSSTEEVEKLQAELEEFKAGPLQEASANYEELNGFVTTMAELGSTDNPYTTLTPTVSCVCCVQEMVVIVRCFNDSWFMTSGATCWMQSL